MAAVIIDIVVVVALFIAAMIGVSKGFIKGITGFVGLILTLIVAYLLSGVVANLMESWFGTTTWFATTFEQSFSQKAELNVPISQVSSIAEAMTNAFGFPITLSEIIFNRLIVIESADPNLLVASVLAQALSIVIMKLICGVALIIILSILLFILTRVIDKAFKSVKPLDYINKGLGFFLGLLKGLVIVAAIAFLVTLIPYEPLQTVIADTKILAFINNVTLNFIKII